jgi:hypothetical protein
MALTPDQVLTATEPVVYIARLNGAIKGVWTNRPTDIPHEAVYESDADVQAFMDRTPPERTAEQKLAAAGLSVADLKQLLGIE